MERLWKLQSVLEQKSSPVQWWEQPYRHSSCVPLLSRVETGSQVFSYFNFCCVFKIEFFHALGLSSLVSKIWIMGNREGLNGFLWLTTGHKHEQGQKPPWRFLAVIPKITAKSFMQGSSGKPQVMFSVFFYKYVTDHWTPDLTQLGVES